MTDDIERKGSARGAKGAKGVNESGDSAVDREHGGAPIGRAKKDGTTGAKRSAGRAVPAHRYGKPAASGAGHTTTERRYGKPAGGEGSASRSGVTGATRAASPTRATPAHRYGKPAASGAGHTTTERRYGKPAGGEGSASRSGGAVSATGVNRATPAHRYGKPAGGEGSASRSTNPSRSYLKPAVGNHTHGSPTPRPAPVVNARRLALDVLQDVHQNGAFAALSLNEHLRGKTLSDEDRRLVTNIVYGALENELQLDYALDKLMDHPTREPSQRDLLRMSAYQILHLDRVPDSAAVNEAVKLCKLMDMEAASGFINAVLRNLVRGKESFDWPKREDDLRAYLNIMGSIPMWIVDRFIADFGEELAEKILMHRESAHPMVVRPNLARIDDAAFEKMLTDKGLRFERGLAPHAFLVFGAQELNYDADYRAGLFSIQGQSSMLAADAVQAKPGMRILDACAAPGGKSAYMCEQMQMTGRVYAWELHEKRALLLEAVKRRLKLENLRISVRDATEPRPDLYGTLDAALLDAPCSGLGVIAQKPDIKLRVTEDDLREIVKTQAKLLDVVSRYVKPGGTLVYSTCSVLRCEDEEQVERFLTEHPEFRVDSLPLSYPERLRQLQTPLGLKLFGYRDGAEGFYIVRLKRAR